MKELFFVIYRTFSCRVRLFYKLLLRSTSAHGQIDHDHLF